MITPEQQKQLIDIKNQIVDNFSKSDWIELGYILGSFDVIDSHPRLLRSLDWQDDDYSGNVLQVLNQLISRDPKNLEEIKRYLGDKTSVPVVSELISTAHQEAPKKIITFSPQVFQIPTSPQNDKLVAVMLPFKLQKTFDAIKNTCDTLSLDCLKADDIWVSTTFIQDIFELIFTSRVVVADFTGKNPNVFYEVGIAHTLGKTVIPITQSMGDIPSDLGHHRALLYHPNAQGYLDLSNELEKRLKTLFPNPLDLF
jgi:hypothetical protein